MTDEYELMPAEELEKLRKEVDLLKANPLGDSTEGKTLLQGVEQLTGSINRLIKIFSDVDQDMANEYAKVKDVDSQLNELRDQNQKIASGILAIAKLVEEQHERTQQHVADVHEAAQNQQVQAPLFPQQQMGQMSQPSISQPQMPTIPQPSSQQQMGQMSQQPQENSYDPFAAHVPQPLPVDPWQPHSSASQPNQQPPVPQQSQEEIPPPIPPPPPSQSKKGVFGLFK